MTWPGVMIVNVDPPKDGERLGDYAARFMQSRGLADALRELDEPQFWPEESVRLHADFCREQNVIPGSWWTGRIDLFGYGTVQPYFHGEDDEWFALADLLAPTGIEWPQLVEIFEEMSAEPADEPDIDGDEVGYGTAIMPPLIEGYGAIRLLNMWRTMQLFALHSPWSREFYEQTKDSIFHAFGLAGLESYRMREDADGTSYLEPSGRPLSGLTREEANAKLTRGPTP
jgi:hypothetical protein